MKILIVDDFHLSQRALENILKNLGHCDMADGSMVALDLFRRAHNERQPYDLLTLDYLMPGLLGPQLLSKIREIEKHKGIPKQKQVKVLMVTVRRDEKSIRESAQAGCHGYIIKPFVPKTILEKIKSLEFNVPDSKTQINIKELQTIFITELGKRIGLLKRFIQDQELENIQRVAHQLHGTGSSYGFDKVSHTGADIEEAVKNVDWPGIQKGLKALNKLYQSIKPQHS